MPIGSSLYSLHQDTVTRWMVRLMGTIDFHSHLRIAPLKRLFQAYTKDRQDIAMLEVGCGSGINLFELSTVASINAVGFDIDEQAIEAAKRTRESLGYSHLAFHCGDATAFTPSTEVDCLLLMDILEHVTQPGEIVAQLNPFLKKGGRLIVSVPTPLYPRIFGRAFHERIGHLVDGYLLNDIERMMPEGYALEHYEYHTGPFAWPACALYYRFIRNIPVRAIRLALGTLVLPFRWVDWIKGEKMSASLFAVFQKSQD